MPVARAKYTRARETTFARNTKEPLDLQSSWVEWQCSEGWPHLQDCAEWERGRSVRFGRVEGLIEAVSGEGREGLRLRVFLETSQGVTVVRDDVVPVVAAAGSGVSLSWQADQYTQETIGVDLAAEGWEVIGASEVPAIEEGEIARSASYAVRQL
jgi:hypothetical protein